MNKPTMAEQNIRMTMDFCFSFLYYMTPDISIIAKCIYEEEHNPLNFNYSFYIRKNNKILVLVIL